MLLIPIYFARKPFLNKKAQLFGMMLYVAAPVKQPRNFDTNNLKSAENHLRVYSYILCAYYYFLTIGSYWELCHPLV